MIIDIDPLVDFVFKWLFGSEPNKLLLISLLNAILRPLPGHEIVSVTLLNPFNLQEFHTDKLSVVDIRATDATGRIFVIEMQVIDYPSMPQRHLFYWAETYANTLGAAEDYDQLKPVILITFLSSVRYPDVAGYHQLFQLWNETHDILFAPELELHTIELPKLKTPPGADAKPLDRWSWFLTHAKGQDMETFPREMLDDPIFQKAFQELQRISNDPEKREEYRRRMRDLREERTRVVSTARVAFKEGREQGEKLGLTEGLRKGTQRGLRKGRKEGLERGRLKGKAEGVVETRIKAARRQIQFLERALRLTVSSDESLNSLSLDELEQRVANLERQVLDSPESSTSSDSTAN